jgi:uncharacterized membrane protein YgdD (TMEM256/DUF423 family)
MDRSLATYSSIILLFAVLFGAFGAHGLRDLVSADSLNSWRTGVDYQFYHGFALLFLSLAGKYLPARKRLWIKRAWLVGILLFCGSIYLLALREPLDIQWVASIAGPITPVGGLCFMIGWGILLVTSLRNLKA